MEAAGGAVCSPEEAMSGKYGLFGKHKGQKSSFIVELSHPKSKWGSQKSSGSQADPRHSQDAP